MISATPQHLGGGHRGIDQELMARMGHANSAAALRYQHATADRDQVIARALSELAQPAEVVPMARQVGGPVDGRAITP